MSNLSGITFTTEDGETIELDKDFVSEEDRKEIIKLHSEEIRERTFRKNIVQKNYHADEKNGRVIKLSKEDIWRGYILSKFENSKTGLSVKKVDHVIVVAIKALEKDEFIVEDVEKKALEIFCKIRPGDTFGIIKEKENKQHTLKTGISPRMKKVCYALGGSEAYEKAYEKVDRKELNRILKEHKPMIVRYREGKNYNYIKFDEIYNHSDETLFKVIDEYNKKYEKEIRESKISKRKPNIPPHNLDTIIDRPEVDTNFIVEQKQEQKDFYCEPVKIELPTKDQLSEKAAITRYIVDKILENPKPGTTMKINNDASIEFKF